MQIHETPTAQQLVQLRSARGMARRQPFEGRGLVGAEVVNIGTGVLLHASQRKVDEGLQGSLLLASMQRPTLVEFDASVLVLDAHAGEVLQPVRGNEWVALEVEEDVADRRLRQPCQSMAWFKRECLSLRHVGTTAGHLQSRLLSKPPVGVFSASLRLVGESAF